MTEVIARASATTRAAADYRVDIQGLRTVAVVAVVLYHLWPNRMTGGFVGVDVFFVISGFLITSHLLRERVVTGTLRIGRFWARRIQRLLPASLLVLGTSLAVLVTVMPATLWPQSLRQIMASTLYVQNWALASDAVDYSAADNVASLVQHFWSLSMEEQFYVVLPLLLVGAWIVAGGRRPVATAAAVLVVLAVSSFGLSVVTTVHDQSQAYFLTHARVWEFATGGLLAVGATKLRIPPRLAPAVVLSGLVAIVWSAITFGETAFPGWVAIVPVAGAAAALAGGATAPWTRLSPSWWLGRRPMELGGDLSYAIYLWHWPLIIAVPFVTGVPLRTLDKLGILGATIALAWVTKLLVEDPSRRSRWLRERTWRAYALAGLGMALVLGGAFAAHVELDRRGDAASLEIAALSGEPCRGPAALADPVTCSPIPGDGTVLPAPATVALENANPERPECQAGLSTAAVAVCELGVPRSEASRSIALVGDSHAVQWFPALEKIAHERRWNITTYAKASCPFTSALRVLTAEQGPTNSDSCEQWKSGVRSMLLADHDVDLIVVAAYATAYDYRWPEGVVGGDAAVEGFVREWQSLHDDGLPVVAIADVPRTFGDNVPNCVVVGTTPWQECSTRREDAVGSSPVIPATQRADGTALVDMSDLMCDESTCYAVVGEMLVYRDYSHLSRDYAHALAPYLAARLDDAIGDASRALSMVAAD